MASEPPHGDEPCDMKARSEWSEPTRVRRSRMTKRKLPSQMRRQRSRETTGSRMRLLSMAAGALALGAGLLAIGATQAASASGYTTGTAQTVSGTQNLNSAACYTSAACVAVGDNGATSGEVVPISNGTPATSETVGAAGTSFN